MGHSFDMLTFDFLLKLPQPFTGLFFWFNLINIPIFSIYYTHIYISVQILIIFKKKS